MNQCGSLTLGNQCRGGKHCSFTPSVLFMRCELDPKNDTVKYVCKVMRVPLLHLLF